MLTGIGEYLTMSPLAIQLLFLSFAANKMYVIPDLHAAPGGQGSTQWNLGWIYRNDGPDIEVCTDSAKYTNGKSLKLELMDMLGRIIFTESTPSTTKAIFPVDTSDCLPGIYLIRGVMNKQLKPKLF